MAYVHMNFESQYLRGQNDVSIILPDKPRCIDPEEFYVREKRYKVLWLLHGLFGDHSDWIRHSNIEVYACERDCIVVMPSAMNTEYENWPDYGAGYLFYDYLLKELMPLIYSWYPASDKREDNFIAGLSMGARGALKIALEHPQKFAGVAAFSAFLRDFSEKRQWMESIMEQDEETLAKRGINLDPNFREWRMRNAVRNNGGSVDSYLKRNDPIALLEAAAGRKDCPAIYCACGTEDALYEEYEAFKEMASKAKLKATFVEEERYGHEWRFWDRQIEKALEFFGMTGESGGREFVPSKE